MSYAILFRECSYFYAASTIGMIYNEVRINEETLT